MSLTILDELEQGTDEWHAARRGMVTASVVGRLISVGRLTAIDYQCPSCDAPAEVQCVSKAKGSAGQPIKTLHTERAAHAEANKATSPVVLNVADTEESRKLTAVLVAERITGHTDPTYMNADMFRGVEDEPRAVEAYSKKYAEVTTVGFMTEDRWGFTLGYSPDGLVGDDGLIEVKSRRQGTQLLSVIEDEVPTYNMPQIQAGLLVSGRKWCDYVSYCGGMHLWTKRVYPDPVWQGAIVAAVSTFEENADAMWHAYMTATTGLALTERVELEMVF